MTNESSHACIGTIPRYRYSSLFAIRQNEESQDSEKEEYLASGRSRPSTERNYLETKAECHPHAVNQGDTAGFGDGAAISRVVAGAGVVGQIRRSRRSPHVALHHVSDCNNLIMLGVTEQRPF